MEFCCTFSNCKHLLLFHLWKMIHMEQILFLLHISLIAWHWYTSVPCQKWHLNILENQKFLDSFCNSFWLEQALMSQLSPNPWGIMYVAFILLAFLNLAKSQLISCPNFDTPGCTSGSKIVCVNPPSNGTVCPTFTCLSKTYKSSKGKTCTSKCKPDCGDNSILCPGPVDTNVKT